MSHDDLQRPRPPGASIPSPTVRQVMVVDDHPVVRTGLRHLLESEMGLEVCGEAAGVTEALSLIEDGPRPDLVVVDLSLADGSGLELIKQLVARDESLKILVSSMYDEEVYAERALGAGARGYIEKSQSPVALVTAMRQVLGGQIYLSEAMTGRLLEAVADGGDGASRAVDRLSDRELEVFELLGGGATTREVARRLGLSVKTVESYRENIKNKLDIDNSNRLIRRAVEWTLQQG